MRGAGGDVASIPGSRRKRIVKGKRASSYERSLRRFAAATRSKCLRVLRA
jgi:hypothetical protein